MVELTQPILYSSEKKYLGPDLLALARDVFSDTFSHLYEAHAFTTFCDTVYAANGPMAADMADPRVRWRVAVTDGELVGYAKLTMLRAPAPDAAADALELQQIYVRRAWHGTSVAHELMKWAISVANETGASELYLTVFDHNERAKRCYRRYGFAEVARCTFTLGDRVDDDRIWMKPLSDG